MRTAKSKLVRVDINKDVVVEASAAAAASKPGTNDWADKKQHYLVLRQRGGSVKWTVRGFTSSARPSATWRDGLRRRDHLADLGRRAPCRPSVRGASGPNPRHGNPHPFSTPFVWTWADLDREYQAHGAQPQVDVKPADYGALAGYVRRHPADVCETADAGATFEPADGTRPACAERRSRQDRRPPSQGKGDRILQGGNDVGP